VVVGPEVVLLLVGRPFRRCLGDELVGQDRRGGPSRGVATGRDSRAQWRARVPGRWRYHGPTSPTPMTPSVTIDAVGIPKNVQLPLRSPSRANRVSPYQTKKISQTEPDNSLC